MEIKKGIKTFITENAKVSLGLPDGIVYEVVDILEDNIEYNIVLNSKEFGKDWVQFFNKEELILI